MPILSLTFSVGKCLLVFLCLSTLLWIVTFLRRYFITYRTISELLTSYFRNSSGLRHTWSIERKSSSLYPTQFFNIGISYAINTQFLLIWMNVTIRERWGFCFLACMPFERLGDCALLHTNLSWFADAIEWKQVLESS